MLPEIISAVFSNTLVFEKILLHLPLNEQLCLRLLSRSANEQILHLVTSDKVKPTLFLTVRNLRKLDQSNIASPLLKRVELPVVVDTYTESLAQQHSENLDRFFAQYNPLIENLAAKAPTPEDEINHEFLRNATCICFARIWHLFPFPNLKSIDYRFGVDVDFCPLEDKPSVKKLVVSHHRKLPLIEVMMEKCPNLVEFEAIGALPDLSKLSTKTLTKIIIVVKGEIGNSPSAIQDCLEKYKGTLEQVQVIMPKGKGKVIRLPEMKKLKVLTMNGLRVWDSISPVKYPNLQYFNYHVKESEEEKVAILRMAREGVHFQAIKNIRLCHKMETSVLEAMLSLFRNVEELELACPMCESGVNNRLNLGYDFDGSESRKRREWVSLLEKLSAMKRLRRLNAVLFKPVLEVESFEQDFHTVRDVFLAQAKGYAKLIRNGLKSLTLRVEEGVGVGIVSRHLGAMKTIVLATKGKETWLTFDHVYMEGSLAQSIMELVYYQRLPVKFIDSRNFSC